MVVIITQTITHNSCTFDVVYFICFRKLFVIDKIEYFSVKVTGYKNTKLLIDDTFIICSFNN